MKRLTTSICLILTLSLFSASNGWGADFYKGWDAYEKGDYATALREWEPLAKQGDADAQYNLGLMYANGEGVLQDNLYAHMWWNIAASQGNENAGN